MRPFVMLLVLLGCASSLGAEEKLRVTVTYRTFSTDDPAKAKWWEEHLQPKITTADTALATLLKHERSVELESLSTIVRLETPFESSQVQGLRTFKVSGTVTRGKDDSYRLDITSKFSERDPSRYVLLPEGRKEAIRERSYDTAVEVKPATAFVFSGGSSSRTSGERIEQSVTLVEIRLDEVKE